MGKRKIMRDDISAVTPHVTDSIILQDSTRQRLEIERREAIEKEKQIHVEDWNSKINEIDPRFKGRTFVMDQLIVKLKKEAYSEEVETSFGTTTIKKINQVPFGQNDNGGTIDPNYIDNPLPYLLEGTIQMIPPHISTEFETRTGVKLEVGAEVQLMLGLRLQERLYYFDRVNMDQNQTNEDFENGTAFKDHDGYFKIYTAEIESFTNV